MIETPGMRIRGVVQCQAGNYRTWTGGQFSSKQTEQIEILGLLPEDLRVLQTATAPLKTLFPHQEWEEWGVEIVEGNALLTEIIWEEKTIVIERKGLGELALLSWDLLGTFLQAVIYDEPHSDVTPEQIRQLSISAQFLIFLHESQAWQYELLASLALPSMDEADLAGILWSLLPAQRASRLEILLRDKVRVRSSFTNDDVQERAWSAANLYLQAFTQNEEPAINTYHDPKLKKARKLFDICNLLSWDVLCKSLPGMLTRYFFKITPEVTSTERRLLLFRTCAEELLTHDPSEFNAFQWPQLSLAVLNLERHPKIHQAMLEFLEVTTERTSSTLWSIRQDETQLAKLALGNNLSEQDDRFFRQATHIQAIWRDILHRSASQDWATSILFDTIEKVLSSFEKDPELYLIATTWSRTVWETSEKTLPPQLKNLKELLWILSQAPLAVLRKLNQSSKPTCDTNQKNWPLLRSDIKKFLHLAPPILMRLIEQVEEETTTSEENSAFAHIELQADTDIPQQDLHGRILPLLARPELKKHQWLDLEKTTALRIIHLDSYLHKSSGKLKEKRFFSSFLFFFKNLENQQTGGWSDLALWIDKDLDLSKTANKKGLSHTVRGLLLEDGIWERTYRYQFLTMNQLLQKLQPDTNEWKKLLALLVEEYRPLLESRLEEFLDYQFYLTRSRIPNSNHLHSLPQTAHLHDFFCLSAENYESSKHNLIEQVSEKAIQSFYKTQFQDDRSWQHAHQAMTQMLRKASKLLHLSPGKLLHDPKENTGFRSWFWESLKQWSEFKEEQSYQVISPEEWLKNKELFIQRLHNLHPRGAIQFALFLLQQFSVELKTTELLTEKPFGEESFLRIFKPIPTQEERNNRQKTLQRYLQDKQGNLLPTNFIELLLKLSPRLLQETIQQHPEQLQSLQNTIILLRELHQGSDKHLVLLETYKKLKHQIKHVNLKKEKVEASGELDLQEGQQAS